MHDWPFVAIVVVLIIGAAPLVWIISTLISGEDDSDS
jgi:hypothetical protein